MKRWLKWLLPVVALAVVGLFVGRAIEARRAEQARATAAKPATGLDLAPNDVVVARLLELPRTLDISGGLKAVNSAIVRAAVRASCTRTMRAPRPTVHTVVASVASSRRSGGTSPVSSATPAST